jgi:monovalent cation:H+ antiporter, CPA1 family
MLFPFIELISLVIIAAILQKNYKIPSPITLMGAVFISMFFNINIFDLKSNNFDNLVLLTLPLLICADTFKLKWHDIKTQALSLFWIAVISVILSILVGVLISHWVFINYSLPLVAVIILFCIISATDPITVSAIFSNFKVPHQLKLLTEGESLFNDATALIIFSLALMAINNTTQITPSFIISKTLIVIFGATVIGFLIGFLAIQMLKLSEEPFVEGAIILLGVYLSYMVAEHFHVSGILAVIVNVIMINNKIENIIEQSTQKMQQAQNDKNFMLFKYAITNQDNHQIILKIFDFIAMFTSATLFISIASIVNFHNLWTYKYEILSVFIASTLIRALMMLKFAFISNKIKYMQKINKRWWAILTFAGSKGALSILMVHMLPNTFQYKTLFENIIVGNILLSIFIYAIFLGIIFITNHSKFEKEYLEH